MFPQSLKEAAKQRCGSLNYFKWREIIMMWMMLQWVHAALAADEARAWHQEQKLGSNQAPRSGATKAEKEIAIVPGLHARPAARFVQAANRFRADVWVEKGNTQVNGKSIL